jgi:hypothetical protein
MITVSHDGSGPATELPADSQPAVFPAGSIRATSLGGGASEKEAGPGWRD